MTILREWRGRADIDKVDAAIKHYQTKLKPTMTAAPGFLRATLAWRDLGRVAEFVIVSEWRDMGSLKAFAGPAPEKAVLPPGTHDILADPDAFVRLYEVVDQG